MRSAEAVAVTVAVKEDPGPHGSGVFCLVGGGASGRDRTGDLPLTRRTLCHLSYGGLLKSASPTIARTGVGMTGRHGLMNCGSITSMARPREITDERLLDAAAGRISRLGPGFTLADVAAEARVAVGTVAQRFGSKHGLLVAMTKGAVDG